MEVISPCFCAGADQYRPEIRAASVRGALRWWLRILGGTPEQETFVFGGVNGTATASKLQVRVKETERVETGALSGNLKFFTSGRDGAALYPGSQFTLSVNGLSRINHETCRNLAEDSLKCFVRMGALGLRATRGAGAVNGEILSEALFKQWTDTLTNISVELLPSSSTSVVPQLEEWLKQYRTAHNIGKNEDNEFGYVQGKRRRRSEVLLRPILLAEGKRAAVIRVGSANR
jgi:CRISPR type III-B/RAMP module RAMP protein Cmr1